ncbi:hypothetical protein C5V99_13945 [Salmonella enterica]|uniref:Uncharacterized protein n=2 Tax=Salmonella enterica TaxID=28901 RepID=A0A630T1S1_SALER|nr:hypothetical protein [Salmonella enterica]EBG5299707.1 hypothetical protein [Salmonella enterica subsp. enterica serovar Oranienburg]EBY1891918.1 hypothetical protein [Salmonella enterica subsp. enterica serovar Welikade]ECS5402297.1 hypothetical protein [Salmonella enterica subsp. enterica serovar Litchfield]EDV0099901.1 hypothetical protein [Salmonella enterica subsp. enterica serovar Mbandaka]EDV0525906.1 hypothetical protein [Salmonella enterica subsp. enterica]
MVMMGIMIKLCGKQFWLAFCEAKDVTRAIKNGGEDFNKKCPPALIFHFITGLSWEYERGHYLPVCAIAGHYFRYVGNVLYPVISIHG